MTMRGLRTGLGLAATALLLTTGCGGAEEADEPAAEGGGNYPVTIEHVFGTTEIPAEPQRIVTLGLSDQDSLLALGVTPIAVSEWYGEYESATWPWASDLIEGDPPVVLNGGVRDEANPPIEEIATLEPDLIVSLYNGTTEEQYEALSTIAPTVLPTEEFADFGITWQESLRVTGVALDRIDRAEQLTAELEGTIADAAAANPQFAGRSVTIAERFEPGESVVRVDNDARVRFFTDLGFVMPPALAGRANEYGEVMVADELLSELDADLVVWNVGNDPTLRALVESLPLWGSLPANQEGRVLWLEDPIVSGAFSWGTVLSLSFAVDEVLPQVQAIVG